MRTNQKSYFNNKYRALKKTKINPFQSGRNNKINNSQETKGAHRTDERTLETRNYTMVHYQNSVAIMMVHFFYLLMFVSNLKVDGKARWEEGGGG